MKIFINHTFKLLILFYFFLSSKDILAQTIILTTNTTSNWTMTNTAQPPNPTPLPSTTDWLINPTSGILNSDWTDQTAIANIASSQISVNANVGNGSQPLWITDNVCDWVDNLNVSSQYNFRNTFVIEDCSDITTATIRFACDNLSRIYINGTQVTSNNGYYQYAGANVTCNEICGIPNGSNVINTPGSDFNSLPFSVVEVANIQSLLVPGINVIGMEVINVGGCGINYAWINANMEIHYSPGIISSNVSNLIHKTCDNNGSFTVTGTSGQAPYTYVLSGGNPQDNGNYTDLEAGTYEVTITDAAGCETVTSVVIDNNSLAPTIITDLDNSIDCADLNTYLEVTVTNGGDNVLFSLDNGPFSTNNYFSNFTVGPHTLVASSGEGCETIFNFNVTENLGYVQNSINEFICLGQSIILFGHEYTSGGIFTDTIPGVGCDTIFTIDISIIDPEVSILQYELCTGETIIINNETYSSSGNYTQIISTPGECDAILNIGINVVDAKYTDLNYSLCEGYFVEVNNISYGVEGNYTQTLQTLTGCDSILNISININENNSSFITHEICPGSSIIINNVSYSSPGVFSQTLTTAAGCDSLLTISISNSSPSSSNQNIELCTGETITINDIIYNSSGSYLQIINLPTGCDSIVNINIIETDQKSTDLEFNICYGESININNIEYDTAGLFTQSFVTSSGCDSLLNIDLKISPQLRSQLQFNICNGQSININNQTYSISGIYEQSFITSAGCDSILFITLDVSDILSTTLNYEICSGETVEINGIVYSTEGTFTQSYTTATGCDSIVNIDIKMIDIKTNNINLYLCFGETAVVNNIVYSSTGNYTQELISTGGCDSILTISVQVQNPITSNLNLGICEGNNIVINNITYDGPGIFTQNLISQSGCDSLLSINLSSLSPRTEELFIELCKGESVIINDINYEVSGTYFQTLTATNGCDSILNITINETEQKESNLEFEICYGQTIFVNNIEYNSSGQYLQKLEAQTGCDSLLNIFINIGPQINGLLIHNLCYGEKITVNNIEYDNSGNYQQILTSNSGCDSLLNINLVYYSEKYSEQEFSICKGDTIELSGEIYSSSGNFEQILVGEAGCDSTLNLRISYKDEDLCADGLCGKFFIPNVFSPNFDGINDEFEVAVSNVTITYMAIYNRWGGVVWNSSQTNPKWNGYFGELEAEPGVYVYMVRGHCIDNIPIFKYGDVTLIR